MADIPEDKKFTLADLDSITEAEWDQILRETEAARLSKKLRRDNPYVLDIIRVLRQRENGMRRPLVLDLVRNNRKRLGIEIPRTFDDTVQQSCERFCVDSDVFKARGAPEEEGLFAWPHGKGKGHWAARQPQVDNWLRRFLEKRLAQLRKTGI